MGWLVKSSASMPLYFSVWSRIKSRCLSRATFRVVSIACWYFISTSFSIFIQKKPTSFAMPLAVFRSACSASRTIRSRRASTSMPLFLAAYASFFACCCFQLRSRITSLASQAISSSRWSRCVLSAVLTSVDAAGAAPAPAAAVSPVGWLADAAAAAAAANAAEPASTAPPLRDAPLPLVFDDADAQYSGGNRRGGSGNRGMRALCA